MVFDYIRSWICPPKKICKPYLDMGSYSAFWRCANLFMATFFLLAASVQLNDDDWWLWVVSRSLLAAE